MTTKIWKIEGKGKKSEEKLRKISKIS